MKSERIAFGGQDIVRLPAHRRARLGIGYAPEDCGIFPDLTVAENLQISHWLAGGAKGGKSTAAAAADKRILVVLPEVRELARHSGLNLSGGEKEMMVIDRGEVIFQGILGSACRTKN